MSKKNAFLGSHLGLVGALVLGATSQAAAADLQNASFDADGGVASPSGWTSEGAEGADYTEWGGYTGDYRLSHYSGEDYFVDTKQTVTGLNRGWYTLRGFARRSSGENGAYLELDCGTGAQQVAIPVAWPDQWLELAVSAYTWKGSCTITLHTDGRAGEWSNFDSLSLAPGRVGVPIRGADVSSLPKSEDLGGLYYSDMGRRQNRANSALDILEDHGTTHLRVRVWVDSADGYHGVEEIARLARRAKREKLELLVDLHYSDFWADPGQQAKPAAWEGFSIEELEAAVYNHTYDVCTQVKRWGRRAPDMIQIGNELNSGMLWPDGHTWAPPNWENLGRFLTAGAQAVRDCSSTTKVVLHLAEGGDNGAFRWWFDNITAQGVDFDVIAASYYGYWHGSLGDLQYNLKDMATRYDKDVLVAETAYPFTLDWADDQSNIIGAPEQLVTGYEASPYGQAENLRDVLSVVRGIPDGRGLGVFYWDATWTVVPGNGWDPTDQRSGNTWENQALFDFNGRALPAMSEFLVDDWGRGRRHRRGGYCR